MTITRRAALGAAALTVLPSLSRHATAQSTPIRLGVLNDQSGNYRDDTGPLSVLCVRQAVEELDLGTKESDRCRNFFAMGLIFWLYDRPLEPTMRYIDANTS